VLPVYLLLAAALLALPILLAVFAPDPDNMTVHIADGEPDDPSVTELIYAA
jgi:hypothetical protein